MSALGDLCDQLADQIRTAVADAGVDCQVEPRMVLMPTTPSFDIYPADPFRDDVGAAFGDLSGYVLLNVRVRLAPTDYEANQDLLLEFLDDASDLSIAEAILADPTLNGHAMSCDIVSHTGVTLFTDIDPAKAYVGVLWRLAVLRAFS